MAEEIDGAISGVKEDDTGEVVVDSEWKAVEANVVTKDEETTETTIDVENAESAETAESSEAVKKGTKRKQETQNDYRAKRQKFNVAVQYSKEGRAFHKTVTNLLFHTPNKKMPIEELKEKINNGENRLWEQFQDLSHVDFETSLELFGTRYIFEYDTETSTLFVTLNPFPEPFYPPINNVPFGLECFGPHNAYQQAWSMYMYPPVPQFNVKPVKDKEKDDKYPYKEEVTGTLITSKLMEERFLSGKKYKRALRLWQKKQQFNSIERLKQEMLAKMEAEAKAKLEAEAAAAGVKDEETAEATEETIDTTTNESIKIETDVVTSAPEIEIAPAAEN